jgi:hypothetical protein
MSGVEKIFRVFVSSTFADMVDERTVLQERVFPRLEAYCRERGGRFVSPVRASRDPRREDQLRVAMGLPELTQAGQHRSGQRHVTVFAALGFADVNAAFGSVNIANAKTRRLAHPQPATLCLSKPLCLPYSFHFCFPQHFKSKLDFLFCTGDFPRRAY